MHALQLVTTLIGFLSIAPGAGADESSLVGPYLGQVPPGSIPVVFAPGVVSTETHEFSCSFGPDGTEFYFTRATGPYRNKQTMFMRMVDGIWSQPARALTSFENENFEAHVTPDGKRLFFMGFNAVEGRPRPSLDLFCAERTGDGWGEAVHLGEPFNPDKAMFVSVATDGTLYTTDRAAENSDIVIARPEGDGYSAYQNIGPPVNTDRDEAYPFTAPDQSYLIYCLFDEERKLMVSFRGEDYGWSEPAEIDLGMEAGTPSVSPDGKYLFFVSGSPGDIYWVDFEIVERLRPKE